MSAMSLDALRGEVEAQVELAVKDLREQLQKLQLDVALLQATHNAELQETVPPERGPLVASIQSFPYYPLTPLELGTKGPMGDQSETVELPENLFTHCMGMLIADPDNVCVWSLHLLFLQWTQIVLLFACTNVAYERYLDKHWTAAPASLRQCIYGENTSWDVPRQDLAAALACIMLAVCTMVTDDRAVLASVYPNRKCPMHVRVVAICFWCIQSLLIPQVLISAIAQLLSTGGDGIDVVLNGLALTFIVDIDELWYECLIPISQRERLKLAFASGSPLLESCTKLRPKQARVMARRLGCMKFVVAAWLYMRSIYLASEFNGSRLCQAMLGDDPSVSFVNVVDKCLLVLVGYIFQPLAQSFAWAPDPDDSPTGMRLVAILGRGLVLAMSMIVFSIVVYILHSELLGGNLLDSTVMNTCFNRSTTD